MSQPPRFRIWMRPTVYQERRSLPGHIRQRVKRVIDDLAEDPRPPSSRELGLPATDAQVEWEIRRVRLDDWRVVYGINDVWAEIGILTIQRRPPYDYADLDQLLLDLPR